MLEDWVVEGWTFFFFSAITTSFIPCIVSVAYYAEGERLSVLDYIILVLQTIRADIHCLQINAGGESLEKRRDPLFVKVTDALGLTKEVEELDKMANQLVPLEGKLVMDACSELTTKLLMLGAKDRVTLALNVVKAYIAVFDRYVQNYSPEKAKELFAKTSEPDAM